jgi:hypothetical protein
LQDIEPSAAIPLILVFVAIIISSTGLTSVQGRPFVAAGDFDCNKGLNTAKKIHDSQLPFLGVGDYYYHQKESECIDALNEVFKQIEIRYGIVGNHELDSREEENAYTDVFGLSTNAYFNVTIDNVLFIGTNVYVDYGSGSDQHKAIERWLKGATTDNIVILVHTPPYSPQVEGGHDPNTKFRNVFTPMFEKYGVDLVISGDNHIYGYYDTPTIDYAICGQAGSGGDTVVDPSPFNFAEAMPRNMGGFCVFDFIDNDNIDGAFYNDKGEKIHKFILN